MSLGVVLDHGTTTALVVLLMQPVDLALDVLDVRHIVDDQRFVAGWSIVSIP